MNVENLEKRLARITGRISEAEKNGNAELLEVLNERLVKVTSKLEELKSVK